MISEEVFRYVRDHHFTSWGYPNEPKFEDIIKVRFQGTLDEVLSQTLDSGATPIAFADLDEHDWRSSLVFNPPEEWFSYNYSQIFEMNLGEFVLAEANWTGFAKPFLQTANLKGQKTQTKVSIKVFISRDRRLSLLYI